MNIGGEGDAIMRKLAGFATVAAAGFLCAGGAHAAEPIAYTWTGAGGGMGHCTGYKMTVDVTVDGNAVKGFFQQEGRVQRHFETTKDSKGMFQASAEDGGGHQMAVMGTVGDAGGTIMLVGYCKFEGRLTKK